MTNHITREDWLQEAAELILLEVILPVYTPRETMQLKLSVGYPPNTKANSKIISCCMASHVSEGGFNEIFISPEINDSLQVLTALTHEIVHALVDCQGGHQGGFRKIAKRIGFEGRIAHAQAGRVLKAKLHDYITLLGAIPHSKINLSQVPRQTNRNLKVWCDCGFKFNTSRTQIETVLNNHGLILCPNCQEAMNHD